MAFSGAWLRQNGPYEYVNAQAVHTADPSHADTTMLDPNVDTYTAPAGTTQTGFGVPSHEWMGGQGVQIEYSPQEHDLGIGEHAHPSDPYIGGSGMGGGELTRSQRTMRQHAESYGGDIEYSTAPMQWWNETYYSIRSESPGPLPINPVAIVRGSNSDPQNNPPIEGQPDGFRRGEDLVVGVDRKFNIGQRWHDRHVVTPNDADAATNQLRGTKPSAYLSPFDTAKRAMTRAWNTPAQLESPPDYSNDIIANSPADDVSNLPDWGFVG